MFWISKKQEKARYEVSELYERRRREKELYDVLFTGDSLEPEMTDAPSEREINEGIMILIGLPAITLLLLLFAIIYSCMTE